jgi:hypothetical protein
MKKREAYKGEHIQARAAIVRDIWLKEHEAALAKAASKREAAAAVAAFLVGYSVGFKSEVWWYAIIGVLFYITFHKLWEYGVRKWLRGKNLKSQFKGKSAIG